MIELPLPPGFDVAYCLAYHGRDAAALSERVEGKTILKPLSLDGNSLLLTIRLEPEAGHVRVEPDIPLDAEGKAAVTLRVRRMLGLDSGAGLFEAVSRDSEHGRRVLGLRSGIHLPQTADAFEALCWAIIGQQINLAFCATLRREMVDLAGLEHRQTGLRAHPTAAQVASLDPAQLTGRRFSRSKASYLIDAAAKIASGAFDLDGLRALPAAEAEAALIALRGIGPWTARYTMMRGLGFEDIAPIGDSGLASALQRLHRLEARPDAKAQEEWMLAFAPYRSLATIHLWAGLADKAPGPE